MSTASPSASHEAGIDCLDLFRHRVVVALDGVPLDTFDAGETDQPPMLLVNAFGIPAAIWAPLARDLARDNHLITWESRGIPNLLRPFAPEHCGVPHHSDDLGAVLAAYDLRRVRVVAWCSGAQVTLRFASLHPDRIEAVVLLSGGFRPLGGVPVSEFQTAMNALCRQCASGRERTQVFWKILFGAGIRTGGNDSFSRTLEGVPEPVAKLSSSPFLDPESLYRYANTVLAVEDEPEHAWTAGIDVPVLLLGGERDQVVHPETWPEIACRIRGSRLVTIPDRDHYMLYQEEAIGGLIRGFFHGLRVAPAGATS